MQAVLWILSLACAICSSSLIETLFEGKFMNYLWKSGVHKNYYMYSGKYNYTKVIPMDVDQEIRGKRIFITVLRDLGVPATVHTLVYDKDLSEFLLKPYPSWEAYENVDLCKNIINVHRIAVDECDRLWILDTGKIGKSYLCPAKLSAYYLSNDRLIFTRVIPDIYAENLNKQGLLVTPIVQTTGSFCEDTQVFIADSEGHGLIIYSYELDSFERFERHEFQPESKNANFSIIDERFTLPCGITCMALSPMRYPDGARVLAYNALASRSIYNVDLRILKHIDVSGHMMYFEAKNKLPSQVTAMAFSPEGALFYGLTNETAIGCYNLYRSNDENPFRIALTDSEKLQFISGMKYINDFYMFPRQEYLLLLSNRFHKYLRSTMDFNDINFRILKIPIKPLITGTVCDVY